MKATETPELEPLAGQLVLDPAADEARGVARSERDKQARLSAKKRARRPKVTPRGLANSIKQRDRRRAVYQLVTLLDNESPVLVVFVLQKELGANLDAKVRLADAEARIKRGEDAATVLLLVILALARG